MEHLVYGFWKIVGCVVKINISFLIIIVIKLVVLIFLLLPKRYITCIMGIHAHSKGYNFSFYILIVI